MKTLYFECDTGAAGDMLCASLADFFDDKITLEKDIAQIGLPDTTVKLEAKSSLSVAGLHSSVFCKGEKESTGGDNTRNHFHRTLDDVLEIINSLNINEKVKTDAANIYTLIARAEGKVHSADVGAVHFHEVGMLDAIADVVVFAYLIDRLNIDKVTASPINVGSGTVRCAHGILPVPAPATAELLKGIPFYKSDINTELCTPTGAAILKYYVRDFSEKAIIKADKIGIGVGTKELSRANIIRAFLCDYGDSEAQAEVCELVCTVDDMTGEELSYAAGAIMKCGALDAYFTPAFMKKGRPAYEFTVLCALKDGDNIADEIFKNTRTIGIRKKACSRYVLEREIKSINTPLGEIQIKVSTGEKSTNCKIEYESVKKLAEINNLSFIEAEKLLYKYLESR